jgi:hypothetical protein
MNGKGDKPRPLGVSQEQFGQNWDRIFLKEIPDHDNAPEGGAMWVHHCTVEGPHMVGKNQPCSWCGMSEDGKYD